MIAELFPDHLERYDSIAHGVAKADIARYAYMLKFGGVYSDTDYKWLRAPDEKFLSASLVLPVSRGRAPADLDFKLGNAVLMSKPGHPFWHEMLEWIFARLDGSGLRESGIIAATGPDAVTDFFLENRERFPDACLPARPIFHPWIRRGGLWHERVEEGIGVHLCWGSWRSKPFARSLKTLMARKWTALT